jgi:flagellar basal body-associated protein FliL
MDKTNIDLENKKESSLKYKNLRKPLLFIIILIVLIVIAIVIFNSSKNSNDNTKGQYNQAEDKKTHVESYPVR